APRTTPPAARPAHRTRPWRGRTHSSRRPHRRRPVAATTTHCAHPGDLPGPRTAATAGPHPTTRTVAPRGPSTAERASLSLPDVNQAANAFAWSTAVRQHGDLLIAHHRHILVVQLACPRRLV